MIRPPGDYGVGYGKPPDAGKFGRRPQPQHRGRRTSATPDVLSLLSEPVRAMLDGKETKLHPHEAMMLSLTKRALKKEIRAIKIFLKECKKAGLLDPPPERRSSGVLVCPKWMPTEMFCQVREPTWKAKDYDRIKAQFADSLKVYDEWFPGAREKAESEHRIK